MVTASKVGTVTTISVDGTAIATINDGAQGVQGETGPTGPKGEQGPAGSYTAGTGIDITNGVISVSFPIAEKGEF